MGSHRCKACIESPVMSCGRCSTTRCERHAIDPGKRCPGCERDYRDEARTRRAIKLIFAPAVGVFTGGLLFAMITFGGVIGSVVACSVACATAVGSSVAVCSLVDRSARAMFLRERSLGVPVARLLPPGRHHA